MKKLNHLFLTIFFATSIQAQSFDVKSEGWYLFGATNDINMTQFENSCVDFIWSYDSSKDSLSEWKVYIANGKSYTLPSNISLLTSIKKGQGFWLKSNGSCKIEINTTISQDINNLKQKFDNLYDSKALSQMRRELNLIDNYLELEDISMKELIWEVFKEYDKLIKSVNSNTKWHDLRKKIENIFSKYSYFSKYGDNDWALKDTFHKDIVLKIVNMLWLDLNDKLTWKISSMQERDIALLYRSDVDSFPNFANWSPIYSEYKHFIKNGVDFVSENAAPDNSESFTPFFHSLLMPVALKIVDGASSQEEATEKLVEWVENNIFHTYTNNLVSPPEDWSSIQYQNYSKVDERYYDVVNVFKERLGGCHLAVRFLKALATSINIPATAGQVKDDNNRTGGDANINLHGATFFPTLGTQGKIIHGDWLTDHFGIPAKSILLTIEDFSNQMKQPSVNWDYVKHWREVKNKYGNELTLHRSQDTLYLDGWFDSQDQDKANIQKNLFSKLGYQFECNSINNNNNGKSVIRCTSTKNKVKIKSFEDLIPDHI